MTVNEKELLIKCLIMLGERLSNDGCNDVDKDWRPHIDDHMLNAIAEQNEIAPKDVWGYNWMIVNHLQNVVEQLETK